MMYTVRKTFDLGLSTCFRQWKAESHCHFLHGYALQVTIEFRAAYLDKHGWVIDFGSLKGIKDWLIKCFDHKTLVAQDDPEMETFIDLAKRGIIDINVVSCVGCESFAKLIAVASANFLRDAGCHARVHVHSVEVREHGANAVIYKP